MDEARRRWIGLAVLAGVTYAAVGIAFAWPTTRVHAWRLAAWVVSAAVFAGHVAFEQVGHRGRPLAAATHVALAVALGAFGLALGAVVHSFLSGSSADHRRLVLIALVAWPIITAVPAWFAALVAGKAVAWWRARSMRAD